jgi:uncharacterized protein YfbU (UPF0304 family)
MRSISLNIPLQSDFLATSHKELRPFKNTTKSQYFNYLRFSVDIGQRITIFRRVMLTCALRAQVKDLKKELKHKFCIGKISF